MLKHAVVLLVVVLAGCGDVGRALPGSPETQHALEAAPPGIVGCWRDVAPAGTYDLTFAADGAVTYAGVKFNGNPIGYTGTWSIDADQLTIAGSTWTLIETYSVQGDQLTITQNAQTSTWTRKACQ